MSRDANPVQPRDNTWREDLRSCVFIALWFGQLFGGLLLVQLCQPAGSWWNSWSWWGSALGIVIALSTFGWIAKAER